MKCGRCKQEYPTVEMQSELHGFDFSLRYITSDHSLFYEETDVYIRWVDLCESCAEWLFNLLESQGIEIQDD